MAYNTITLSQGETRILRVGSNETISDLLIDQTARNAHCTIRPENNANNWTVRNVGWRGKPDGSGTDFIFLIPGCGDGLVENIFMDAMDYNRTGNTYIGGGHLGTGFHGEMHLRHCYIRGFGNNGYYGNMPASSGGGDGPIHYYDCLHRDNTPSNFRPGAHGSTLKNCVAIVNDPDGYRGYYYTNNSQLSRPVWHWDGTTTVTDMSVYVGPRDVQPHTAFLSRHMHSNDSSHMSLARNVHVNADSPTRDYGTEGGGTIDVSGLGHSPTMDVMVEGVPTTPEMAANGERHIPTTEIGSGTGAPPPEPVVTGNEWAFISEPDASEVYYEFRAVPNAEGNLNVSFSDATYPSPSGGNIQGGTWAAVDFIDDRGDEVYAGGGTGGGHGDSFDITGEVTHVWIIRPEDMFIWIDQVPLDASTVTFTEQRPSEMDLTDPTDPTPLPDPTTPAPDVATAAADNATDTSARLNGDLTAMNGNAEVNVRFDYRKRGAAGWTQTSNQPRARTGTFSATVSGLAPDTEYEFRAVAVGEDADGTGSTLRFRTNTEAAPTPPEQAAFGGTVRVDGQLRDITRGAVRVGGELRNITGAQARLDGQLEPILAPDVGATLSVRTITPATEITETGARVHGNLTILESLDSATVWFQYRRQGSTSWQATPAQVRTKVGTFSADLTGLDDGTTYEFRAMANAGSGEQATSSTGLTGTFTTPVLERTYDVIDSFEDGVATAWINAGGHATAPDLATDGARSAYRIAGGAGLLAGPTTFDSTFGRGTPFMSFSLYSASGTRHVELNFGRESRDTNAEYAVHVDWANDTVSIRDRPAGGTWTTLESTPAALESGVWYDITLYWGEGDGIKAWVNEAVGGGEVASVETYGTGRTGQWWGVWLANDGAMNQRLDFVRSTTEHPHTGQHYTNVLVDSGATIDDFDDGTFADGWRAGVENYRTVADSDAEAGWAAYRNSRGALIAHDDDFPATPTPGSSYLVWTMKPGTTANYQMFYRTESATSPFGGAYVNFAYYNGEMEIRHNDGTGETKGPTQPITIPTNDYSTGVGYVDTDDIAHYWVYDPNGKQLGYITSGVGEAATETTTVAIQTVTPATNIGETSATLTGRLTSFSGVGSVTGYFQYRQVGASTWQKTSNQNLAGTGEFTATPTNLAQGTQYEYRAVAVAGSGDTQKTSYGAIDRFSTAASGGFALGAQVTDNYATADGADTNEWTVRVTESDVAQSGENVEVSGGDTGGLNGVTVGSSVTTDINGEATFTASATAAGDYTLEFTHPASGATASAIATYSAAPVVYDTTASVTQNNALANGSSRNQWTATVTADGAAANGETVEVTAGDTANLDGIAIGDTAITDANGKVTFSATTTTPGSYSLTFTHTKSGGSASATATFATALLGADTQVDTVRTNGTAWDIDNGVGYTAQYGGATGTATIEKWTRSAIENAGTPEWSVNVARDSATSNDRSVAISPEGDYVACAFWNTGAAEVYDTADGSLVATFAPGNNIYTLDFSKGGAYLAYTTTGGVVHVAHTADWGTAATIDTGSNTVRAVDFSPDGQYLACADTGGNVHIYAVGTWTQVDTWNVGALTSANVSWSPDGSKLAYGAWGGTFRVYAMNSNGTNGAQLYGATHGGSAYTTAWTPDGSYLFTGEGAGGSNVHAIDTSDWTIAESLAMDNSVESLSLFNQTGGDAGLVVGTRSTLRWLPLGIVAVDEPALATTSVANFEGGTRATHADWGAWTGDTGYLYSSSTRAISGTHSGSLEVDTDSNVAVTTTHGGTGVRPEQVSVLLARPDGSANTNGYGRFRLDGPNGNVVTVRMNDTGDMTVNGTSIGSWDTATVYAFTFVFNWASSTFRVYVNGADAGVHTHTGGAAITSVEARNAHWAPGDLSATVFDDIEHFGTGTPPEVVEPPPEPVDLTLENWEEGPTAMDAYAPSNTGVNEDFFTVSSSSPVLEGTYSLRCDKGSDDGSRYLVHPTDGLERGKTYSVLVRTASGVDTGSAFDFAIQDPTYSGGRYGDISCYEVRIRYHLDNGRLQLNRRTKGSTSNVQIGEDQSPTLSRDTTYRYEIEYGTLGSPIVVRLYNMAGTQIGQCSGVDDTYVGGTYGFAAITSGSVLEWWDDLREVA